MHATVSFVSKYSHQNEQQSISTIATRNMQSIVGRNPTHSKSDIYIGGISEFEVCVYVCVCVCVGGGGGGGGGRQTISFVYE